MSMARWMLFAFRTSMSELFPVLFGLVKSIQSIKYKIRKGSKIKRKRTKI